MAQEFFDETLEKLVLDLKEQKFWDDLVPEKVTEDTPKPPETLEAQNFALVRDLQDLPIIRYGAPKSNKFAYVSPQNFNTCVEAIKEKFPNLKKKIDEAKEY